MTTATSFFDPEFVTNVPTFKRHFSRITEDGLVGVIATIVPWFAFVPNAYYIYKASETVLGLPTWVCWVVALVIECMGVSTIHSALKIYIWNQAHDEDKHSPFWLAVTLAITYVLVVIALVVVLKIMPDWSTFAPAIFPILAIDAAVLVAIRDQHNKRVQAEKAVTLQQTTTQAQDHKLDNTLKVVEQVAKIQKRYGVAYDVQAILTGGAVVPQLLPPTPVETKPVSVTTELKEEPTGSAVDSKIDSQNHDSPLILDSDESAVLQFYAANPEAKQRAVAAGTGLSQATVSRVSKRLESRNLIQRNQDGIVILNQPML